ncbi:flagellar biosynthetic protein FliO [Virgibacillus flavescens]|uniref:flagellar biosynthetic protein FliO n=1 Tax=Virgibacillus flavescens TaxID=1611422 RepID=UPI003D347031
MNKLLNKISICIFLIVCYIGIGQVEVSAEAPNAKECIEGNVDCGNLENQGSNENSDEASKKENDSLLFMLVKMFFALVLVLALIYLLLKFLSKRNKLFSQVKALENVGGVSVGQNKSIQIIRIGDRLYVVGVGDNVELMHEITDEAEKQEILQNNKQSTNFQSGSFLSSLFSHKNNGESSNQPKSDFKNLFAGELDKLKNGRSKMINHHKRKGDKHE